MHDRHDLSPDKYTCVRYLLFYFLRETKSPDQKSPTEAREHVYRSRKSMNHRGYSLFKDYQEFSRSRSCLNRDFHYRARASNFPRFAIQQFTGRVWLACARRCLLTSKPRRIVWRSRLSIPVVFRPFRGLLSPNNSSDIANTPRASSALDGFSTSQSFREHRRTFAHRLRTARCPRERCVTKRRNFGPRYRKLGIERCATDTRASNSKHTDRWFWVRGSSSDVISEMSSDTRRSSVERDVEKICGGGRATLTPQRLTLDCAGRRGLLRQLERAPRDIYSSIVHNTPWAAHGRSELRAPRRLIRFAQLPVYCFCFCFAVFLDHRRRETIRGLRWR